MRKYLLPQWLINTGFYVTGAFSAGEYPLAAPSDILSCESPLFIISSGRAGTTLLRSILVASGKIAIPQEFPVIHKLIWYFLRHGTDEWSEICQGITRIIEATTEFPMWEISLNEATKKASLLPENHRCFARILDIYLETYAQKHFPGAIIWGDQSPLHTFFQPWILPAFPHARYLHLLRDGRDVIASFQNNLGENFSLEEATTRWKKSIQISRRLRQHLPDTQFLEICYEDLVQQPELTLGKVASYLGIDYRSEMLIYWQLSSTVEHKHLSHHQNLNKPIFSSSIGKWKERLTQEQQDYVLNRINPTLKSLGYV